MALSEERQQLLFRIGEGGDRASAAPTAHQPGDDRRVDDALAVCNAANGVREHGDVGDTVFEEVADSLGVLLEQPRRIARLNVLRENEDAYLRIEPADLLGSDQPLVRLR